jgi:fructose-1,6-bisphosphatase I
MLEAAFKEISHYLREYKYGNNANDKINEKNSSGDVIKDADIVCENIIINHIKKSSINIVGYISEETKTFVPLNRKYLKTKLYANQGDKEYIIAFDPLDGSSNMTSNINTGTIYAIYEYDSTNCTILNIIKAGYCLYGPATILVETHYEEVTMKQLDINNEFIFCKKIDMNNNVLNTKIISINHEEYEPEINYLKNQYRRLGYKHRWSGTMVADVHRLLINDGLFFYTSGTKAPNGKIRFLYEAIPMAFIFSKAGGIGLNESFLDILKSIQNYRIDNVHKKTSIILCSKSEYVKMTDMIDMFNTTKY